MKKLVLLVYCVLLMQSVSYGQVLISLLLGDKLNSDKLEFGLTTGLSMSQMTDLEQEAGLGAFQLGFYFDVKMKEGWSFAPSCLMISKMGGKGLEAYETGDPDMDIILAQGKVNRELSYIQLPLLVRYKLKSRLYFNAGPQVGLLRTAEDVFEIESGDYEGKIRYQVKGDYARLDAGATVGLGYSLRPDKGMSLGVNYYFGLVDVSKAADDNYNRSWNIYATIPIGVSKAEKKANKQAAQ
ncbi:hypothetical protein BFP72_11595 [Reichenbachiella sp. 5M10]|uniref:porin family protein n=1 Tax=Reichenbachiella sp. 5M10 TaxID=1889772 RepID=UPI000C14980D|nr:porin family protein [Reichenbachiella sp. 5M10]PIB35992.1 hypothetical protein BFP72_11595 [Reichenbachiella sp. 5M10]